jgi:Uma2 family endonuclease
VTQAQLTAEEFERAFMNTARIPAETPKGFAELAPDLVVEVLSPDDRPGEVSDKTADWLNAGVNMVWILDPLKRSARVIHASGEETILSEDGSLDGGDVLPGFTAALTRLFAA